MLSLLLSKMSIARQIVYSVLIVLLASLLSFAVNNYVGYHVVAFIYLVAVSLVAVLFDIVPVLITALVSALAWNFFFIAPYYTLYISAPEDAIFLMTYFLVAITGAILTYKIRRVERRARDREGRNNTIRLYNTLLNSLSHELRTPIATVMGASEMLQANKTLSTTAQNELVTEIAKAAVRLNRQVENLLNMSRLESGFIQPRTDWCDFNELLHSLEMNVEENGITQTINVAVAPDFPLVKIDKGIMEQVLYNLVWNATQYTPADSIIDVLATVNDSALSVIVQDNGHGFPPDEIDKVFDKFNRLRQEQTGGTGLGLSIVKGFVKAMGGNICLQNKENGGAKFTISMMVEVSYLKNFRNE